MLVTFDILCRHRVEEGIAGTEPREREVRKVGTAVVRERMKDPQQQLPRAEKQKKGWVTGTPNARYNQYIEVS